MTSQTSAASKKKRMMMRTKAAVGAFVFTCFVGVRASAFGTNQGFGERNNVNVYGFNTNNNINQGFVGNPNSQGYTNENVENNQGYANYVNKESVPFLAQWQHNSNGSLTGYVFGSPEFPDGTRITTSMARTQVKTTGQRSKAKTGMTIRTKSGGQYKLGEPQDPPAVNPYSMNSRGASTQVDGGFGASSQQQQRQQIPFGTSNNPSSPGGPRNEKRMQQRPPFTTTNPMNGFNQQSDGSDNPLSSGSFGGGGSQRSRGPSSTYPPAQQQRFGPDIGQSFSPNNQMSPDSPFGGANNFDATNSMPNSDSLRRGEFSAPSSPYSATEGGSFFTVPGRSTTGIGGSGQMGFSPNRNDASFSSRDDVEMSSPNPFSRQSRGSRPQNPTRPNNFGQDTGWSSKPSPQFSESGGRYFSPMPTAPTAGGGGSFAQPTPGGSPFSSGGSNDFRPDPQGPSNGFNKPMPSLNTPKRRGEKYKPSMENLFKTTDEMENLRNEYLQGSRRKQYVPVEERPSGSDYNIMQDNYAEKSYSNRGRFGGSLEERRPSGSDYDVMQENFADISYSNRR